MPKAAPSRSLHASRAAKADATAEKFFPGYAKSQKNGRLGSIHVLESPTLTTWQELPVGGINRGPDAFKKIWYNHAVVPIFVVIGLAAALCCWFMFK